MTTHPAARGRPGQGLLDLVAELALGVAALALLLGLADTQNRQQAGGQRGGDLLGQRLVGLAEQLAALGVTEDHALTPISVSIGAETSPVKAPSSAWCMFCA